MDQNDFRNNTSGQLTRTLGGHWAFVPHNLPPKINWSEDLVISLSAADRALGELAGLGRSLPNPHLLVRPFVRREAVLSSRIEGTQASLTDLYAYEARQSTLWASPPDARDVHNYVQALDYGLHRLRTLPVSLRLIRELHAQITEGVRGMALSSGEFRNRQNWIGTPGTPIELAIYVPPPVEQMHELLSSFEQFLHAASDLPPLIRLGMIHYQFEAIHPFIDGNGRLGRLLMSLLMCSWGMLPQPLLYLSAYFSAERAAYYDNLLIVSREGAWNEWLRFFLRGVLLQSNDAVIRICRITDLRDSYRSQFQAAKAGGRLMLVIDYLFDRPVLSVNSLAKELGVGYATANRYIAKLEDAGVIRELTGQARNRVYRADDVLAAFDEPLMAVVEST
jgi:Fic family protein